MGTGVGRRYGSIDRRRESKAGGRVGVGGIAGPGDCARAYTQIGQTGEHDTGQTTTQHEATLLIDLQVSGTPVSSLRHLASHSSTSNSRRAPSRSTTPKRSLSISIRSVRRRLSRRLRRKTSREAGNEGDSDEFTEFDSQSGFGSVPPVQVVLSEKERGWVVLIPEQSQDVAPPLPEKEGCMPSPTCLSSPSPTKSNHTDPELDRELYIQSPHLGHRSPDHHHRQSVLSYISVGRWSASTQGRRRKRDWIVGMTIGCLVGVTVLTGVLAGVLSKRANQ